MEIVQLSAFLFQYLGSLKLKSVVFDISCDGYRLITLVNKHTFTFLRRIDRKLRLPQVHLLPVSPLTGDYRIDVCVQTLEERSCECEKN